jgi:hypothetical protein
MSTTTNRPIFRKIHRKLSVVVRWCEENAVPATAIRTITFHSVYGFGQGGPAYVVDWSD